MTYHRFKLGQTVVAHAPSIPSGPYVITRLLPLVGKEPHYQGKSENGVVRALLESQIRAVSVTPSSPGPDNIVRASHQIRAKRRR